MPNALQETHATKETSSTPIVDIDAYFERIDYKGDRAPTLETLQAIHQKHAATIPFENLNPLLRWAVKLDIGSLQQKIIREHRGGYCFEQNILLSHMLKALGFKVTWLAARVLWNRPAGVVNPKTHMLLLVKVKNESYIADVGFGGCTLTAPIQLIIGPEQSTPHEPFRLTKKNEDIVLEVKLREEWKPLYYFNLQEQLLPDYEVVSYYLCHHPDSHFLKTLRAARSGPGYRYALNNNEFAVHYLNGPTERKILSTVEEVLVTLQNIFLIKLPDTPELKKIVASIMNEVEL